MIYFSHLWKLKRHHVICHKFIASKWGRLRCKCGQPDVRGMLSPLYHTSSSCWILFTSISQCHSSPARSIPFRYVFIWLYFCTIWMVVGDALYLIYIWYFIIYLIISFSSPQYPFLKSIHIAMCSFNLSFLTWYIIVYDFYSPGTVAPIHTTLAQSLPATLSEICQPGRCKLCCFALCFSH